ncbi:MAG: hypothetical protein R3362_03875, partial [Rhodothermales bacterium]|nr:hypothetical protein [Rhodothermales bacterium]
AHDAGGVTSTDTVYALYQPVAFSEPASAELPEGRGALAAAPLPDGRILVTGGAPAVDARATDTALQFVPAAFAFEPAPMPLLHARMGHAATALPDGRVLLTGGALHFEPESLEDFVTGVELYDPATEHFTAVPVVLPDGQAAPTILRTRHTATLRLDDAERPVLYLYGGVGNRSRFGQPSIGPLEFMRVFRFEDGDDGPRLVALGPPEQFRFAATAGHTLSPLDPPDAYLVAGTAVSATQSDPLPFVLAFTAERIETRPVPAGGPPRTDHAAAPLAPGLVAVVGGRTVEAGTAIADAAIFAHEAEQFFALPDGLPTPRWAPSATNVGQGRILIVGGFTATGTAFARSALLYPAP